MPDSDEVRAELEEQRCLIERQNIEIQRQRRQMEVQLQLAAVIQAELDAIRLMVQRVAPIPQQERPTNGNGHEVALDVGRAVISSSQT